VYDGTGVSSNIFNHTETSKDIASGTLGARVWKA
jgi:hypothetical protein